MSNVSEIITMGVGTPSTIPYYLLVGLGIGAVIPVITIISARSVGIDDLGYVRSRGIDDLGFIRDTGSDDGGYVRLRGRDDQ